MMTVAPPVVHPSLGLIALMHGVAAYPRQREEQIQHPGFDTLAHVSFHWDTSLYHLYVQPCVSRLQRYMMEIAPPPKKKYDGFVL